jgi:DNA-binding NtrC family response regulator
MIKKRILFVDDEPEICELAAALLQPYWVTTAFTFTRAKNLLADAKFDLLVSDYHLLDGVGPDLDGARLPLILITGDEQAAADAELAGTARTVVFKDKNFSRELRAAVEAAFSETAEAEDG